jgi:spore germination protein YaaH
MSASVTASPHAAHPTHASGRRRAPVGVLSLVLVAALLPAGPVGATSAQGSAATGPAGAVQASLSVDPGISPLAVQPRALTRVVYGYLPYWRLDDTIAGRLQYDLISTIAFFGLGIKADGNIDTAWRGYTAYMSDNAVAVTNAAHARGVRVVPTFQLFDSSSLTKMNAFLNSPTAQDRFIAQALALMERRSADGASLDFEPLPDTIAPAFLAFVGRFGTAMKARFPTAQLTVATSAGAGLVLTTGLHPLVDLMFVMTYNYHSSGSGIAGPIAPLDNTTRTVKIHIGRFLARGVPPSKLVLGIGYYGYDWPVTANVPYATVRSDRAAYGGVWSVTYGSVMAWLAAHPAVVRHEDTVQGSGWFTYWSSTNKTWREVYFEDEQSAAAKDDYAIAQNLGGIGIWTLGNDGGYPALWNVIRSKFFAPIHKMTIEAGVSRVVLRSGLVYVDVWSTVWNRGNVPERGTAWWGIRDRLGRGYTHGTRTVLIYPGRSSRAVQRGVLLGRASSLPAGTYQVVSRVVAASGVFVGLTTRFRQPY